MKSPALGRLASPPRTISPRLSAQMHLGGANSQLGWFFLGFGSIFFWAFAWHSDLSAWRFKPGATVRVRGRATGCKDTHYSVGGRRGRRGTPIYENRYHYDVAGQEIDGRSYATGNCLADGTVSVYYLLAQPEVSRIAGMRRDVLPPWGILGALLPGVGVAMVIAGLVLGHRRVRLLRDGLPASGRLVDKVTTRVRTNGRMGYRMTFEFTRCDGIVERTTVRTNYPEKLEDEPEKLMLYNPDAARDAVAVDSLPGSVVIGESGQPATDGPASILVLPALAILGNAWYLCRHLVN